MLRLIVETAIHWMQIGLPLKVLKIVVFSRDTRKTDQDPLLKYYRELKHKWVDILKKSRDQPQVSCMYGAILLPLNFPHCMVALFTWAHSLYGYLEDNHYLLVKTIEIFVLLSINKLTLQLEFYMIKQGQLV